MQATILSTVSPLFLKDFLATLKLLNNISNSLVPPKLIILALSY